METLLLDILGDIAHILTQDFDSMYRNNDQTNHMNLPNEQKNIKIYLIRPFTYDPLSYYAPIIVQNNYITQNYDKKKNKQDENNTNNDILRKTITGLGIFIVVKVATYFAATDDYVTFKTSDIDSKVAVLSDIAKTNDNCNYKSDVLKLQCSYNRWRKAIIERTFRTMIGKAGFFTSLVTSLVGVYLNKQNIIVPGAISTTVFSCYWFWRYLRSNKYIIPEKKAYVTLTNDINELCTKIMLTNNEPIHSVNNFSSDSPTNSPMDSPTTGTTYVVTAAPPNYETSNKYLPLNEITNTSYEI